MCVHIDGVLGYALIPSCGSQLSLKGEILNFCLWRNLDPFLCVSSTCQWEEGEVGAWDKGTPVLASESLCTVLTWMFRNDPFGDEDGQNKTTSNRNQSWCKRRRAVLPILPERSSWAANRNLHLNRMFLMQKRGSPGVRRYWCHYLWAQRCILNDPVFWNLLHILHTPNCLVITTVFTEFSSPNRCVSFMARTVNKSNVILHQAINRILRKDYTDLRLS